ncbi:hypothetical protein BBD42_30990 [Paenibacillus sp. BIHB 4019]|uniref:DUF3102 domain-containing protein n=1 Tax=Paenibacillus sp. BIHB 4019 TaxID=1870819 RepID=A0A1B2DRV4_9BACL|nr:DUF3102 domain-containing protein [Paenibacillus sp. BIHB 4019]ANY70431.1 hypothetical protein BBD42_30990 [Paenibacillus sp. BIHB 4019]
MARAKQAKEIVRTPEVIAAEIRSIDVQARKYVLQSAIEIGRRLTEAKELVAHGEWGNWLQTNVSYGQSSANNFMKVAAEYADSQTLGNLSYSQAVALLSLPAEEREAFAEEHNASGMSTRELQAAIKAQQEAEKEKESLKLRLDASEAHAEILEANFKGWAATQKEQQAAVYEQYQAELALRKSQEDKVRELEQEIEKAQQSGNKTETAKLKTELRKAEKASSAAAEKAKELEEELKQKEAELAERLQQQEQELKAQAAEKEATLQEQLDKLMKQLERSNNEAFLKAKFYLQGIIDQGKILVTAIEEVKEPEEKVKLKAAAANVADQLRALF